MTELRVSVIIGAYNAGPYLAAALDSVLAQTEPRWELIVVNDGSTDNTAQVLTRYAAEPRLHVLTQPNSGLSTARNRALAIARAPWVALLDADDLWQPAYLATLLTALEAGPPAVAAFAGWQYLDAAGLPLPQSVVPQAAGLADNLLWRNPLVPSGAVIQRAALDHCGGFDPALPGVEDWDMWLRLAPHGPFLVIPQVLVFYRTHAENLSDRIDRMEASHQALLTKHLGPLPADLAAAPPKQRRAQGALYFNAALGWFRQRQAEAAFARLAAALRAWPAYPDTPEFYFELACAYQPRGRRGRPTSAELAAGAELLRRVLLASDLPPAPEAQRRAWWSQACLVLAQLAPDQRTARRYAAEALRFSAARRRPTALRAWLRAALPAPILSWAQRLRRGAAHHL